MHKKPKAIRSLQEKFLNLQTKAGNIKAYTKIYQEYYQDIYKFIYFKTSSAEKSKDLTQDVFLKVWHYIQQDKKEIENIRALLYQSARNLVIDYYRKKKDLSLEEDIKQDLSEELDIEKKIDLSNDYKRMRQKLKEIKPEYQEIIILKYLKDLPHKEIAKIMGKSTVAVRVDLHRALKELKALLVDDENKKDV